MDKFNLLKNSHLFAGLDDSELNNVASIVELKKVDKSRILFFEGDEAHGFYLLLEGRVKIYKSSPDGKEQILHIISSGQIFAEAAIFHGNRFPANCMAVDDSLVAFFPKDEFISLIKNSPRISLKIIASLSAFVREFTVLVENLSLKEVPSRIATYLLQLAEDNDSETVTLEITKSELAKQLGTLSETLSRGLRKLMDSGIIQVDGNKITIRDPDRLNDIAKGEKI
jgi:CRP-like cAMP-binding protein